MDSPPRRPDHDPTAGELAQYFISTSVGLGMLIMVLAPFAIPFLALTALFALPLLLPVILLALIGAIVAAPVLLVRRRVRRFRDQTAATSGRRHRSLRASPFAPN